jgi:tRNA 2-thiouridine synthesizing protein E
MNESIGLQESISRSWGYCLRWNVAADQRTPRNVREKSLYFYSVCRMEGKAMSTLLEAIRESGPGLSKDPEFPHAPAGWTRAAAVLSARQEGHQLGDDHWEAVRALQQYFAQHEAINLNLRELHDALNEKFHNKGGLKYLYQLFPGGPVAQGCRFAGLKAPAGAIDKGFGSVV